ncbi:MAG: membrane protein insertion efficiency factor YidD [Candidatus Nanopelagicales bacterium]|nr:membrane protein insertion efficiency factor YidD [Candidatus Nanopelagicales bacterium]
MSPKYGAMGVIGTPIRVLLRLLIGGYRRYISPCFAARCRYHPSCSAYALEAVEVHGAFKGTLLGGWRLLRCNPFSGGGYDPVPERGSWLPEVHPDGRPRAMVSGRRVGHQRTSGDVADDD